MKKHLRIILPSILIFGVAAQVVIKLWEGSVFIFDHSAKVSSNYVLWNGREYSSISGEYSEGRTIAKGEEDWVIDSVNEDPTHTFIVARSFLDQYLMVADDYTGPANGELTTISWNGTYITDTEFLTAVSNIDAQKATSFTYQTYGIYELNDNQHMRELYFAYENCPVTTIFKGYMGKVDGKWVITTSISADTRNEDGSPKLYSVNCYEIPNEYWDVLSKFFS